MASANFNTQIVSSSGKDDKSYILDEVITKDFEGNPGYNYTLDILATPVGVSITQNEDTLEWFLTIPPLVEFELSITVSSGTKINPIKATATTSVVIDGSPSFSNEVTKFLENSNYTQNKENTIKGWSEIISKRISTGDSIDGPVRFK